MATLRILLVEDDDTEAEAFADLMTRMGILAEIAHADSREAAVAALERDSFDLLVLDLEIPSFTGSLDKNVNYGFAVYEKANSVLRGAPIAIVTGHRDERQTRAITAVRGPKNLFGLGEQPSLRVFYKDEIEDYLAWIRELAAQLAITEDIQIESEGEAFVLSREQARVLRIAANRFGCTRIAVSNLSGYSDSLTVKASFYDADQHLRDTYVAKLDGLETVNDEALRFERIAGRLPAAAFAPLGLSVVAGCGAVGGNFYTIEPDAPSLFEFALKSPSGAGQVVRRLQSLTEPWRAANNARVRLVRELREEALPDGSMSSYRQRSRTPWREFENMTVALPYGLQHGDLHGMNVFARSGPEPLIIDFGNVDTLPICCDPITLEFGSLFHKASPVAASSWPTLTQARRWFDGEQYFVGCPIADFLRECRQWVTSSADRIEIAAVVYSYALRQLKYDDTDEDIAMAIADGAVTLGLDGN